MHLSHFSPFHWFIIHLKLLSSFWGRAQYNIFQLTSSQTPPISITPLASNTLSDSVEISWTIEETKEAGGTIQYAVIASPDGGESWLPIGLPTISTSLTIPTDFLPASNNIIFKVVGSSGLGSNSAEVSNLIIENRNPKAIIVSPENGWVGDTKTKWILKGYGVDNEDETIPEGIWTSSLDGQLNTETDIFLSSGKHTLTFKVTDSGGLEDSSSVEVEVKKTMEDIDLSLNEECLTLITPNRDPLDTSPIVWLEKDGIHGAILKIRNVGTETIFTASLFLKGPSDTDEKLLTNKVYTPGAFDDVVLSETFIVEEEGTYQIRGEITNIVPTDNTSSNNEWIWTYQTQPNEPVIEVIPEEVDFGDVKEETNGFVIIRNYGKWDLAIKSLTITGPNSGDFSIDQEVLDYLDKSNIYVNSSGIFVPVYFSPTSIGEKEATLTIESYTGEASITLKGNCLEVPIATGDINANGVVDISDVILCLRMAIGLDTAKPAANINKDGVVDISDVILILRKAIGLDK